MCPTCGSRWRPRSFTSCRWRRWRHGWSQRTKTQAVKSGAADSGGTLSRSRPALKSKNFVHTGEKPFRAGHLLHARRRSRPPMLASPQPNQRTRWSKGRSRPSGLNQNLLGRLALQRKQRGPAPATEATAFRKPSAKETTLYCRQRKSFGRCCGAVARPDRISPGNWSVHNM